MSEGKLDPRLRFLSEQDAADQIECAAALRISQSRLQNRPAIEVLLRCRKDHAGQGKSVIEDRLRALGVDVHAAVDGRDVVVACAISMDELDVLMRENWVELIEAGRAFSPDLD